MNRRHFLAGAALAAVRSSRAMTTRPPRILLRSSWQTINIGDVAHTPGVIALIEKHIPEAEVRLWPSDIGDGVREMLARRFPGLVFVEGTPALNEAFADCDFLLHGSGPSLVGAQAVERWARETGKPFGVYGITLSAEGLTPRVRDLLDKARFLFLRDGVSLELARSKGLRTPVIDFAPDGAFAADVSDDAKATAFLATHGLEEGRFLCCIPRYRHTPYWTIPRKKATVDAQKQATNAEMKEHDHVPLREAIVRVVTETSLKVLVCPEDQTQVALGKEMIVDKLPEAVRSRVVWRPDFWLTDEAISTYTRSAGLFGNEMHSPILCIGHGVPAIVCRWASQTSKGTMWRDIGLGDWLFDFDAEADTKRMPEAVLAMAKDPAAARARAAQARAVVERQQRTTMDVLRRELTRS